MKCALCGKEIKGKDYIHLKLPDQKEINVHAMSCKWYDNEGNVVDAA